MGKIKKTSKLTKAIIEMVKGLHEQGLISENKLNDILIDFMKEKPELMKNYIKNNLKCETCSKDSQYSEKWDAYYCSSCNEWKSPKCKGEHKECNFNCKNRPKNPLDL